MNFFKKKLRPGCLAISRTSMSLWPTPGLYAGPSPAGISSWARHEHQRTGMISTGDTCLIVAMTKDSAQVLTCHGHLGWLDVEVLKVVVC